MSFRGKAFVIKEFQVHRWHTKVRFPVQLMHEKNRNEFFLDMTEEV